MKIACRVFLFLCIGMFSNTMIQASHDDLNVSSPITSPRDYKLNKKSWVGVFYHKVMNVHFSKISFTVLGAVALTTCYSVYKYNSSVNGFIDDTMLKPLSKQYTHLQSYLKKLQEDSKRKKAVSNNQAAYTAA